MKLSQFILGCVLLLSAAACRKGYLDREIPVNYSEDEVFVNYERMSKAGYGVYTFLFNRFGFHRIDNAMLASASDEADHADVSSSIHRYNMGTWNAASNPEDCWAYFYQGIRRANLFLQNSTDYKNIIFRDTLDPANKSRYEYNVRDIEWLRAEVRFLRACYNLEQV